MAWYLNTYECDYCSAAWEDEWSCLCDDECPYCGASDHSPVRSEDLSAYVETAEDGRLTVFYSHPSAGHKPDYRELATTKIAGLAELLRAVAFELAKPT
ncbi:hypothetical protein [Oceaniradius stylonematis]|uniref:hypothetical protein n=1 Tax=Oceaniradius stylonematis TaxID=2184161 RepID=UPI000F4182C7|nr:MAG: hypothetical protein ED558_11125 [Oricola sp.]